MTLLQQLCVSWIHMYICVLYTFHKILTNFKLRYMYWCYYKELVFADTNIIRNMLHNFRQLHFLFCFFQVDIKIIKLNLINNLSQTRIGPSAVPSLNIYRDRIMILDMLPTSCIALNMFFCC